MKKKLNEGFIDIHSHILFDIDDGPKDLQTSLKMLEIAHKEGIREMVATPHFHPEKCMLEYALVMDRFHDFREEASKIFPEMKLYLGRENYYTSDLAERIEKDEKLAMPGEKYFLVEYSPRTDYAYIKAGINNILHAGMIPMIAHVERYECMIEDIDRVEELRRMGTVIQVNSASVTGDMGKELKKYTKKLLKNGYVDVIASDAHSAGRRSPKLAECATYITKKYGYEYAENIFINNPKKIIKGKYLEENN